MTTLPAAQVVDAFLTAEALGDNTLTPDERRLMLTWLELSRDFDAGDPHLWAEAERFLSARNGLRTQLRVGAISRPEYETQGAANIAALPMEVFLAALSLQRSNVIAWQHVASRHATPRKD